MVRGAGVSAEGIRLARSASIWPSGTDGAVLCSVPEAIKEFLPVVPGCQKELFPFQRFQFIQGSWPVLSKESGQATVCQHFASGLTLSAVVRLVIGIANTLHRLATSWTGLAKPSMYRHIFPKRRDLLWEVFTRFRLKSVYPKL